MSERQMLRMALEASLQEGMGTCFAWEGGVICVRACRRAEHAVVDVGGWQCFLREGGSGLCGRLQSFCMCRRSRRSY